MRDKIKLGSARFPQLARARRGVAWRGERGGGACEGFSLCHILVSGATLYYIRWSNSPSTSNVGLNFSTTSTAIFCHAQVGQMGQQPKTHQIPTISHKVSLAHHITFIPEHCFIYRCVVETVKLNFHVKLHATLDCNLNSGLCLELQVWCALVSHKV